MLILYKNDRNVRFVFKEQSPQPSVLLGQTKPEGFSPRVASDPTKHKGEVIVPIIKHLDRAVCLTQQNMAAILGGLFASPNKTWQPSWEGYFLHPTKHGSHLGRAVCLTQQNMASHSANQIARNEYFVILNNASGKFLVLDIRKATFVL